MCNKKSIITMLLATAVLAWAFAVPAVAADQDGARVIDYDASAVLKRLGKVLDYYDEYYDELPDLKDFKWLLRDKQSARADTRKSRASWMR